MRLIDADALKETIINICGNCSNIIREYKDGVPDGNCAIQHIMNMIDNTPTFESHVDIEITEHHTFAKPDDVSDIKFGD